MRHVMMIGARRFGMSTALLLILSTPVAAQVVTNGPITTANKAAWEMPNEQSAGSAQGLTYRMRVDQPLTGPFTVLTGVTCALVNSGTPPVPTISCSANVPAAVVTLTNVRGAHNLSLTAFDGTSESASSIPFVLTVPPSAPGGFRILAP